MGLYLVLVGGTDLGTLHPELRAINGLVAGGVIAAAIARTWPRPDRVSGAAVLAVIGFTASALLSPLPRYALDAAISGVGYAAAFLLLRGALADSATYVWARQLLAVVAVAFIATYTVLWMSVWLSWLSATGFTVLPPLTLPLPTVFIRHAHVVAFTAALLLPAVWGLPRSRLGDVVRAAATVATLLLVLASGSRTVLLAVVVAAAAAYGFRWRSRIRVTRSALVGVAAAGVLVLVAIVLAGSGGFVLQRLLTLSSLAARGEIWGATLAGWLERPLFGFGPGSFSLAFPLTGYFDANEFSPRHADNALIQSLFEAGVIGVALVLPIAGLVLWRALLQVQRPEARWSVLFVAVGTLTDNPTDTVGLVALMIFWASAVTSVVAPAAMQMVPLASVRWRPYVRSVALAAFSIIAITWVSVTAADFAYAGARRSAAADAPDGTRRELERAAALDPLNAFYRRQLGVLHAVGGDLPAAASHLEAALALNPADDVTSRSLGLVYLEQGREEEAGRLTARSTQIRRTDLSNHLTRAHLELETGRDDLAAISAARVVEMSHWIVAADDWQAFLDPIPNEQVTDLAIAEAQAADGTVMGPLADAAWVLGLAGRGAEAAALGADARDATAQAIGLMFDCRLDEAADVLNAAVGTEGSSSYYWLVRYVVQSLSGADTAMTERMLVLFSPTIRTTLHATDRPRGVSPLIDELRDAHLYHRLPMRHATGPWSFPNAGAGSVHWLRDPASTAAAAAPRSRLAECAEGAADEASARRAR